MKKIPFAASIHWVLLIPAGIPIRTSKRNWAALEQRVRRTIEVDFALRRESPTSKRGPSLTRQIRSVCDYIAIHIKEKLSIAQLAKQAGYTEYYFSHK